MTGQKKFFVLTAFLLVIAMFTGCGEEEVQEAPQAVNVKTVKVVNTNAPLRLEFSGEVIGKGEVKVQPKVAGLIVEKYIQGGQTVTKGQRLYKIDSRQYEAAVLQAQAQLAKANTTLRNAQTELRRNEDLFMENAIAEQKVTDQRAAVEAQQSEVVAQQAILTKAREDLADTVVYAPMTGVLSIDDVAVGTYASPGATNLVTIGADDPIFVQFSISEMAYLNIISNWQKRGAPAEENAMPTYPISLTLADGSTYTHTGHFAEVDRSLAQSTGTLTIRALFDNPQHILVPGMYTRVAVNGINIPNSLMVPERALQQLLGETFVIVATADNKAEIRKVKLGNKIGAYYVVTEGIKDGKNVVIEGLTKLQDGTPLSVEVVKAEDVGISLTADEKPFEMDKTN